jgi:hypothetical protein
VGVNPADGLYVPLADTDAVPTVVPPVLQSVGELACGPNTVNVIVPVGLAPPDSVELIEPAGIAVFAVPLAGADTDVLVEFTTVVEVIPDPQPLFDARLPASPP